MLSSREKMKRRALRNRSKLRKKVSNGRPRLSVFRSSKHIYAQLIDDQQGVTLAAASTAEADSKESGANVEAAASVGKRLAERATKAGIKDVVFDRGGFIFHGRIKALAEAAREGGLNF
ncbi:50S ribosomal protein L18 [Hyphobacterium sp. CCMP332]|jgi:large subunit ribosomal protein L18|uniref:50S ribosomal protein L18 n=1 Tax=unclassified Hyphobacterium TaxID=2638931 RepID=UPI00164FE3B4|nr:50S ribosomal protein L18 [Hyphobacterium sp. CCMP332]QNL18972.1 50S ribosomal protein L18 [Hyphobacterium sp. CCMP332]